MKAVIDRITGDKAVLLVGQDEKEYRVSIEKLPVNVKEGSILEVECNEKDEIIILSVNLKENEDTAKRISNKMNQLRQRKSSHFKRKE